MLVFLLSCTLAPLTTADRFNPIPLHYLVMPEPTAPCTPVTFWEVETTDTYGGEANYCWVRRALVCTPALDNWRTIRMLREAAGLTNTRARFCDHGDMLEWRQPSACVVTFAIPQF
jgi:hypothetical protein